MISFGLQITRTALRSRLSRLKRAPEEIWHTSAADVRFLTLAGAPPDGIFVTTKVRRFSFSSQKFTNHDCIFFPQLAKLLWAAKTNAQKIASAGEDLWDDDDSDNNSDPDVSPPPMYTPDEEEKQGHSGPVCHNAQTSQF